MSRKAQSCSMRGCTHSLVCSHKNYLFWTALLTKSLEIAEQKWIVAHYLSQSSCPELLFMARFGFWIHIRKNNCIAMIQSLWHQFPTFPPESVCLVSLSIYKCQVISVTHGFPTYSCLPQRYDSSKLIEYEGQDLISVLTLWLHSKI